MTTPTPEALSLAEEHIDAIRQFALMAVKSGNVGAFSEAVNELQLNLATEITRLMQPRAQSGDDTRRQLVAKIVAEAQGEYDESGTSQWANPGVYEYADKIINVLSPVSLDVEKECEQLAVRAFGTGGAEQLADAKWLRGEMVELVRAALTGGWLEPCKVALCVLAQIEGMKERFHPNLQKDIQIAANGLHSIIHTPPADGEKA